MKAPHESDSPEKVSVGALGIAARVKAEPKTSALAKDTLASRKELKARTRGRQDAEDAVAMADGVVNAGTRRTNRELAAFGKRLAGAHVTARVKGEKSPEYVYVFNGTTASKLLPGSREERMEELAALTKRIANRKAGAQAPKLGADLLKAIEKEEAAIASQAEAQAALDEARASEEKAKVATVVAVRVMASGVQATFAEEPALARDVLGYGNSAATRKKNAQLAKAAKNAKKDGGES